MSVEALSFVKSVEGKRVMWSVEETGDWAQDNEIGKAAAIECLRYMRQQQAPNILALVMEAMIAQGRSGGVEVGFMTRIAIAAIA